MSKRLAVLIVLAVVALSAGVHAEQQITYSRPFVSTNSPLKLCATATDGGDPVSGVGLWFQAWTLAGIPRTNGPVGTVYTNALGKACNLFNLNEGLYEIEAFGTDGFDGVSSEPVVVSNWKIGPYMTEGTSAGIATYRLGNLGPSCSAAFGLLIEHSATPGSSILQMTPLRKPGIVSQSPRAPVQFLWLDECNPAGPIRIEVRDRWQSVIVQVRDDGMAELLLAFTGYAWVTTGDGTFLGWMEFFVHAGPGPRLQPINHQVCVANGTFGLKVVRFTGQKIYDVTGPFAGTTCTYFPIP